MTYQSAKEIVALLATAAGMNDERMRAAFAHARKLLDGATTAREAQAVLARQFYEGYGPRRFVWRAVNRVLQEVREA